MQIAPDPTSGPRPGLLISALALVLLAWDATGLDLQLAHAFGGTAGFALRDNWFLYRVLHEGGRHASWLVVLCLCLAVWWPVGFLRRLGAGERLQLAVTTLLALLAVSALKSSTGISCPWDLAEFGGVARHASHWTQILAADGGGGRCFPAGHASAGFAFAGGWFVFRRSSPRIARAWLAAALAAGFTFGIAQQMRGAHFMSHTFWTAWLCWTVAWLVDAAWPRAAAAGATATSSGEPA
ncbi:MAG: phosphatase PAP2 family protein [Pseudomonadota bacterium]